MCSYISATSSIELLPNEILLDIFSYLSPPDLHTAFYVLNRRFTSLLHKINVKCEVNKDYSLDIKYAYFFASRAICLSLYECKYIDVTRFPRVHSLILYNPGRELVHKIRPEFFPHLKYLIIDGAHRAIVQWWTLLHNHVFSNGFPNLYKACLISVCLPSTITTWTGSSSIRELKICWVNRTRFLGALLLACPNLCKLKLILDQFYLSTMVTYVNDMLVEVNENIIPNDTVKHCALRHLEIECSHSVDLYSFLESLLRCVPRLKQLQVAIYSFEDIMISYHTIARLLRDYLPELNSFYCKIPMTDEYLITFDETFQGDICRMHSLFKNVETKDNKYLIVSSI